MRFDDLPGRFGERCDDGRPTPVAQFVGDDTATAEATTDRHR